ncbi:MAG: hypothetical protein IPN17_02570 [Deltaproteobacteria bacterium]|nr:hypothetical protein [Deltaproteobacteria bacterium]
MARGRSRCTGFRPWRSARQRVELRGLGWSGFHRAARRAPLEDRWDIACRRVAELSAPAITLEVDSAAVERALDEAQRAVRSAAETTPWREMMDAAGWTDADLEPQLYIRLDQPDDARQGSATG